ncbi:MarR family winged helix-turn-helix transcriptional regulator [Dactylosporangium sp. CA-139114]|uniref:MarR family winged helix-turn-helix transcriptional regulator n=1 Tax=Dactylosporangium sp. CA-139114 TaxID=3239931 RepID=UPI003D982066
MTTVSQPGSAAVVSRQADSATVPVTVTVTLWQITRVVRRHLERTVLGPAGLSLPDYAVLQLVGAAPGAKTLDVGRRAGMAKATLNGIVGRLEARGLLARRPAQDKRVVQLGITPDGRAVLRQLRREAAAAETTLLTRSAIPAELRRLVVSVDALIADGRDSVADDASVTIPVDATGAIDHADPARSALAAATMPPPERLP